MTWVDRLTSPEAERHVCAARRTCRPFPPDAPSYTEPQWERTERHVREFYSFVKEYFLITLFARFFPSPKGGTV